LVILIKALVARIPPPVVGVQGNFIAAGG